MLARYLVFDPALTKLMGSALDEAYRAYPEHDRSPPVTDGMADQIIES